MNTDQRSEFDYPKCPACRQKFEIIILYGEDGTTKKMETTVCQNKECSLKVNLKEVSNWKLYEP